MKLYKRFLKSNPFIKFMSHIASAYIRFVYHTSRWHHVNRSIPESYWDQNKPFICAFWHNRILMAACGWQKNTPLNMLISKHSDGKLISKTIENFNIKTIAGSKNKGGTRALRQLLKALKSGESVGITPDGPRGPRFVVSEGVLALAKISGCPIIPGTYSIKRRKILNSWDKCILALPFSKGVFVWGDPIFVPKNGPVDSLKGIQQHLTESLCDTSNEADRLCGHAPLT